MFAENNPAGVKAFMYKMGLIDNQLEIAQRTIKPVCIQRCRSPGWPITNGFKKIAERIRSLSTQQDFQHLTVY